MLFIIVSVMINTLVIIIIIVDAWWRHQMETFSALLALCAGNTPATGEFPSQRPVTRRFDVFFDLGSWANNGDAGDMRRCHAHCAVIVIDQCYIDDIGNNILLNHNHLRALRFYQKYQKTRLYCIYEPIDETSKIHCNAMVLCSPKWNVFKVAV